MLRYALILTLALTLNACAGEETPEKHAVDPHALAPLTSREQALLYSADGAFQQGNFAAAERDYMGAAAITNGHIDAHLALARLYDRQHNRTKERDVLERALTLQPNHPFANYLLGKIAIEEGRFDDALSAFQHGRVNAPDDLDLSAGEAVANDMLGQHQAAQMLYERAMKQNPEADLTNLRTNLAMSYLLTGNAKKAVSLLKDDAKKPTASTVTRHNLALAYGLQGEHEKARALVKGEIDEETRTLTLARLKEYLTSHGQGDVPPIKPTIGAGKASEIPVKKAPKRVIEQPVKTTAPTTSVYEEDPEDVPETHHEETGERAVQKR